MYTKDNKSSVTVVGIDEKLTACLHTNIKRLQQVFGNNPYLITRSFMLCGEISTVLIYLDGLADRTTIQEFILQDNLHKNDSLPASHTAEFISFVQKRIVTVGNTNKTSNLQEIVNALFTGNTILFFENQHVACITSTKGGVERSITEPTSQNVVRGPRDGFTESLQTNVSLILRRIKTPHLHVKKIIIGTDTHTEVGVLYHNQKVDFKIVNDIFQRLHDVQVNGILESSQVEPFLLDPGYSPFPTVYYTERPDIIAAGILEGRVAIIIDGSPFVLLVPSLLQHFLHANEDAYQSIYFSIFIRLLRYFSFFCSMLLPGTFIAITCFHQELIPLPLFVNLVHQRYGAPFPPMIEMLLMEITFELLREAGLRLPRAVGNTISIVGALVIGESAVQAGIVSPATIIIVAGTAIMSFILPVYSMSFITRLLRFGFLFLAGLTGIYGLVLGIFILLAHLCSVRSFGQIYFGDPAVSGGIIRSFSPAIKEKKRLQYIWNKIRKR
ncbi:spore germination protein [Bacillus thuringiensis]|nr:spore germination protein [Bacillus thuringiensis]